MNGLRRQVNYHGIFADTVKKNRHLRESVNLWNYHWSTAVLGRETERRGAVYLTEYPRASMQAENPRLKVSICLLYAAVA